MIGAEGAEQIARVQTTRELFRVFGVVPALGRDFTPEETQPGKDHVVILGYAFWQRWFGGDPAVLGRRLYVGVVAALGLRGVVASLLFG